MANQEEARAQIANLVADFKARMQAHARFNERQTGASFIEPLFEALGWAVRNPEEVSVEFTVARERADYIFRSGGVTRFIVEAKAPHRDLNNPDFKKQAITYAYNKGVSWAVLTNFSELRVFNAENDREFLSLNAENYLDNFDDLWLLSKEAFATGSFQQKAQAYGAMQPLIPVEKYLFGQLRLWRGELFNQIHHHNPGLTMPQIDELIQTLFNRLIFIRTAEDRGIEENRLRAALHQWISNRRQGEFIERLRAIFHDFAQSYDSDLFPQMMDRWGTVFVEGSTLETIIGGLYDLPGRLAGYDFSAIDADVLGAVYEQYLGYVAEVEKQRVQQAERQLKLLGTGEDLSYELTVKKEKRKGQGIYYTPKWVVDYIVRQTVGRFLEEHTHDEIINMKILDPACGSGSFLIRAYDELLRYHARVQGKTPAELDWQDRLPILTRNIFGVDLDDQAVQIARLNLLLRALAQREILPGLKDNIRRGNSLISGSEAELKPYFGDAWREKHPFNWEQPQGFPDIMAQGGFDVVIGNPPYVRVQSIPENERSYLRGRWRSATGHFDTSIIFVQRAAELLKPGGLFGFITSGKFLKSIYGRAICSILAKECTIVEIIDLSALQVFGEATTYPVLLIFRKGKEEKLLYYSLLHKEPEVSGGLGDPADRVERLASQDALLKGFWPPPAEGQPFTERFLDKSVPLSQVAERIFVGPQTDADRVFIMQGVAEGLEHVRVFSRATGAWHVLERGALAPLLKGEDVKRYHYPQARNWIVYPYKRVGNKVELLSEQELLEKYPLCHAYLAANGEVLKARPRLTHLQERWFAFGQQKNLYLQDQKKLCVPRLCKSLAFTLDTNGEWCQDNVDVCGVTLPANDVTNYYFILGILNSKLIDYYFQSISAPFRGGYRSANRQFLEPLPIRCIDFDNPAEKAMHDRLVALVERMLALHKRKADKSLPQSELEDIEREIARTDNEIDTLVYNLYGLTQEEIQIVEEAAGR